MISVYRDKWRSIEMLTESIDREKVTAVIKAAYAVSEYPEPEMLFGLMSEQATYFCLLEII
jgi:hypothetical protein